MARKHVIHLDGADYPAIFGLTHLDEYENVWFTRQLEYVSKETYDQKYPELKAQKLIPFTNEGGEGSKSFVFYQYNKQGMWKTISNYGDDLPRTTVNGKEFVVLNKDIGGAYAYTYRDILSGRQAGMPLEAREAIECRDVYERTINRLAWFGGVGTPGSEQSGLVGLVYHPNVTKISSPMNAASTSRRFAAKTPQEMAQTVISWVRNQKILTKGIEVPDTICFDIDTYTLLNTTAYTALSGSSVVAITPLTVLGYLKSALPEIKVWDEVADLGEVPFVPTTMAVPDNTTGSYVAVMFKADKKNLRFNLPMPFKQMPVQERNMEYVTNCIASASGMIIQYPLSVTIIDNI